jgi:hypothetical protein
LRSLRLWLVLRFRWRPVCWLGFWLLVGLLLGLGAWWWWWSGGLWWRRPWLVSRGRFVLRLLRRRRARSRRRRRLVARLLHRRLGLVLRWRRRLVRLRSPRDHDGAGLHSDGQRHRDGLLRLGWRIVLGGDWSLWGAVFVDRSGLGSSVLLTTAGYRSWSWGSLRRVVAGCCRGGSCVLCVVVAVAMSVSSSVTFLSKDFRQLTFFCYLVILESFVYSVIGNSNIITGNRNAFNY